MALSTNLVSYWKLDESSGNASDSASTNTLTNNGTATYSAGKINNGVNLAKASSQSLSIADASQTGLDISGNFTFSLWAKSASALAAAPDGRLIINKDDVNISTPARAYAFVYRTDSALNSGNPVVQAYVFASDSTLMSTWWPHTISTTAFEHFVVLCTIANGNATKFELYINGVSQGNGSNQQTGTVTSIQNAASPFQIGAQASGGYYDGSVDEIGIWSRVLTSTEVASLYNSGSGLQYPFATSSGNPAFLLRMI